MNERTNDRVIIKKKKRMRAFQKAAREREGLKKRRLSSLSI